jgi:hypothetical protein
VLSINGKDVEVYLNALLHASLLKRDNNDYLISYRFDTDAEIAFDPRTKNKASIFVSSLPQRLLSSQGVGAVTHYPPEQPSTALGRVSSQLNSLTEIYRIEVKTTEALSRLIEWQRWA